MANKKKDSLLGMSHSTANHKLKKAIIFKFVQLNGLDICFQCEEKIESIDDLSIEHKTPWMSSENPIESFFDLDNIAFSHLSCNSAAAARPHKKYFSKEEKLEAEKIRDRLRYRTQGRRGKRRKMINVP